MNVFNVFADRYIFQILTVIKRAAIPITGFDPLDGIRQPDTFQCGTMAETIRRNDLRAILDRECCQRRTAAESIIAECTAGQGNFCQCGIVECIFADLL